MEAYDWCQFKRIESAAFSDKDDPDFDRFKRIHPDIFLISPVWRVAREKPHMLEKCLKVAKVIASGDSQDLLLCEFCGRLFRDRVVHYACVCSHTALIRETFWDIVNNEQPIELAVFFYLMKTSQTLF